MTLTEAAFWTRRGGVLLIAGFLIFVVIATVIYNLQSSEDPLRNYLRPNFACTDTATEFLDERISIPTLELESGSEPTISIDTQSGRFDTLPKVVNVYELPEIRQTLTAKQKAIAIAKSFGFPESGVKSRGAVEYYWEDAEYARELTIDARTLNYSYVTDLGKKNGVPKKIENEDILNEERAKQAAKSFLVTNRQLSNGYELEPQQTTLIEVLPNGDFVQARSLQEADLIRVDFFRRKAFVSLDASLAGIENAKNALSRDYQDYRQETQIIRDDKGQNKEFYTFTTGAVYDNTDAAGKGSNIAVYVGYIDERKEDQKDQMLVAIKSIYQVEYQMNVINEEPCGTYELLSPFQISTLLTEGKGSLIYLNVRNGDTVTPYQPMDVSNFAVTSVNIAYYDAFDAGRFMEPIFVITGEATFKDGLRGDFIYYLPAINYDNVRDKSLQEQITEQINDSEILDQL